MTERGLLADEVALVTGATSGLGKAIARSLVSEGATTVLTGRSIERGEAAIQEIRATAHFISCDLRSEQEIAALIARIKATFGSPSIVVNNAVDSDSMSDDGPVVDVTAESFSRILSVNVVSVATICRLVIPAMVERGRGSIVNISSRAASRGTPNLAAYSASKGAINALTRSMAMDYSRKGVRINTVQAGYILHEVRDATLSQAALDAKRAMHLLDLPTANDVADVVLFLAGPKSGSMTGVTLEVDAGSSQMRGATLG